MHTVEAILTALRSGRIGAEELARAYLARIERYDGHLNAVAELAPDALAQARALDNDPSAREKPLFGLPILLKDNIDARGMHTTAGSPALTDNLARRDADVVVNLRRNGALILGKTNMTEFANYTTQDMPGGFSARGGQVKNAYGDGLDAGGSSTGSAAAVSAGLCAAAIGTDTSFSVVACATLHGLAGLKPPHGALSARGILPIAHTLDSAGPLTRTFSDALTLYRGMRDGGYPPVTPKKPHKLRLAVNRFNQKCVSDAQMARYERLFDRLRAAGATLEDVEHPYSPDMKIVMRYEFRRDLEAYLASSGARRKTLAEILRAYVDDPTIAPYGVTYLRAALAENDDAAYRAAMARRARLRAELDAQTRPYDACVMTGPTSVMHLVGMPSLALPMGMGEDGAPRGLILYGADEARLYAAALAVEPFCDRVTPPSGFEDAPITF